MVKGILADANALGQVEFLVQQMQCATWADFWQALGIGLMRFEEVGLLPSSSDLEIWQTCQARQLILVTDNRNHDSADSLEATIRRHNAPDFLPVFTIADMNKYRTNRSYVERVVESFYD